MNYAHSPCRVVAAAPGRSLHRDGRRADRIGRIDTCLIASKKRAALPLSRQTTMSCSFALGELRRRSGGEHFNSYGGPFVLWSLDPTSRAACLRADRAQRKCAADGPDLKSNLIRPICADVRAWSHASRRAGGGCGAIVKVAVYAPRARRRAAAENMTCLHATKTGTRPAHEALGGRKGGGSTRKRFFPVF